MGFRVRTSNDPNGDGDHTPVVDSASPLSSTFSEFLSSEFSLENDIDNMNLGLSGLSVTDTLPEPRSLDIGVNSSLPTGSPTMTLPFVCEDSDARDLLKADLSSSKLTFLKVMPIPSCCFI